MITIDVLHLFLALGLVAGLQASLPSWGPYATASGFFLAALLFKIGGAL